VRLSRVWSGFWSGFTDNAVAPLREQVPYSGQAARAACAEGLEKALNGQLASGRIMHKLQTVFKPWKLDVRSVQIRVRNMSSPAKTLSKNMVAVSADEFTAAQNQEKWLAEEFAHEFTHVVQARQIGFGNLVDRILQERQAFGKQGMYDQTPPRPINADGKFDLGLLDPLESANNMTAEGVAEIPEDYVRYHYDEIQ
jgi:hypothetical protein